MSGKAKRRRLMAREREQVRQAHSCDCETANNEALEIERPLRRPEPEEPQWTPTK